MGASMDLVKYQDFPFIIPEAEAIIRKVGATTTIYVLELECAQASADTAAEVVEDRDAEIDGTAAAKDLVAYTKDAKDTAAGVGAQEVTMLTIVGGDYHTEAVATAGLNAESTTQIDDVQRFINAWVTAVGTEKDNAAEIEIRLKTTGTIYQTIAAGANKTGNSALWIAPGYRAKLLCLLIRNADAAGAGAGAATIVDKVRVRMVQANGSFNETHVVPTTVWSGGSNLYQNGVHAASNLACEFPDIYPLGGEDTAIVKVYPEIESFDDGDPTSLQMKLQWLLWKEA